MCLDIARTCNYRADLDLLKVKNLQHGRFFEDFAIGEKIITGSAIVEKNEIVSFARRYDRQPFHVDQEAARKSIFKGIVASGFHTLVLGWSLFLQTGVFKDTSIAGLGLTNAKWIAPVRPGDVLHEEATLMEKRESSSGKNRGVIVLSHSVFNQRDAKVLEYETISLIAKRPPSARRNVS